LLVTVNLDHVVTLARDAAFRDAYANAWLITADGMPVYLYARARGVNVPERVTGADLCPVLLDRLAPGTSRLFIMPSSAATAARIEEALLARGFAPEALRFVVPPFGFEDDPAAAAALAGDVATHRTTHLFLGLGAPKSEIWANRHRGMLGDCYVLAFGAGLDFYAGTKPRAPSALRRIGLEWVWRLASEPRRLARRYLVRSWWFLWLVLADIAGSPPPAGGDGVLVVDDDCVREAGDWVAAVRGNARFTAIDHARAIASLDGHPFEEAHDPRCSHGGSLHRGRRRRCAMDRRTPSLARHRSPLRLRTPDRAGSADPAARHRLRRRIAADGRPRRRHRRV
jgi:N-acetylglucosaminyldiphosphoundecaprenol N-acetyl-beta-D-mannosaminyltransferase